MNGQFRCSIGCQIPPGLIRQIVDFFYLTLEIGRIADSAPTATEAYETISPSLPRVRTHAAILLRRLEKFEAAGFMPTADIRPTSDEIRQFAADGGHPLDEILRQSGTS